MAFIIDTYDKYDAWDKQHAVFKFLINGNWYAIKKVKMEWGLPQIATRVDEQEAPETYYVYETYEEALEFAEKMKALN